MVTTHDGADSGSETPDELLWNIKTVILKTGLSRPSIYRYMKRGQFPPRRRVGPNRVAWVPADIVAWIEGCPRLDQH
jgi:prophage regulatory protein